MKHRNEKVDSSLTSKINQLLRLYCQNFNSYEIDFLEFVVFVKRCLYQDDQNELFRDYALNTEKRLSNDLELLSHENNCSLEFVDNAINKIFFPRYFIDRIYRGFRKLDEDIEVAFPTEDSLHLTIPQELVTIVNIKTEFINLINTINPENPPVIVRLLFPELINSIIITSDLIIEKLLDYAVFKIKLYMDKKRNSSYIENKIFPIFRTQSRTLKEMMNNIMLKTGHALATIKQPTDFTFRFWAHFANLIIQEYKTKNDLLPNEHDYCQAAYLIGFFNIHYRGVLQKEKERLAAVKLFEKNLVKPPFLFTLSDLYNFRDKNGFLLLNKYSRNFITKIIEKKIHPEDSNHLPELVHFSTSNGQDYYIHKSVIMNFCFQKVAEVSHELRKYYINQWIDLLRQHKKNSVMSDEIKFIEEINEKIQVNYPVLGALLNNYYLLYLANEECPADDSTRISLFFDRTSKTLQPTTVILGLDRQQMLDEAKSYLPFWENIPLLRWIITLFRRIFFGRKWVSRKEAETISTRVNAKYRTRSAPDDLKDLAQMTPLADSKSPGAGSNPSLVPKLRADYKKSVIMLKEHFIGKHDTISTKLEFLAEKWNPLYDTVAKSNLVEDVNSMIRDYLRTLKRGFRVKPPTVQQIKTMAATLVKNKHFDEIRKKDFLKMYIEVYMIKILGENKF